jgi:hypothetical protein
MLATIVALVLALSVPATARPGNAQAATPDPTTRVTMVDNSACENAAQNEQAGPVTIIDLEPVLGTDRCVILAPVGG